MQEEIFARKYTFARLTFGRTDIFALRYFCTKDNFCPRDHFWTTKFFSQKLKSKIYQKLKKIRQEKDKLINNSKKEKKQVTDRR